MPLLRIAKEFSAVPAGRYLSDGPTNGERFREQHLLPKLRNLESGKLTVVLDGVEGYPSSFLDEAFGGLVRKGYFTPDELRARLEIVAETPSYKIYQSAIWDYIERAAHAAA